MSLLNPDLEREWAEIGSDIALIGLERLHWKGTINLETNESTHQLVDYSIEILGEIEWSGDMPTDGRARGTNASWRLIMGKAYGKNREQALRRVRAFQDFKKIEIVMNTVRHGLDQGICPHGQSWNDCLAIGCEQP